MLSAKPVAWTVSPAARKRSATPRWSRISIVRACSPPAREPASSWLGRRSSTTASTPASASSAASISPVGPPPAITTECSVIHTLLPSNPRLRRGSMGHGRALLQGPHAL